MQTTSAKAGAFLLILIYFNTLSKKTNRQSLISHRTVLLDEGAIASSADAWHHRLSLEIL